MNAPGNFDFAEQRVSMIVNKHRSLNINVHEYAAALDEAARLITDWRTFRRYCANDLRIAYCNDRDTKVKTVHNSIRTWKCIYKRFKEGHSLPPMLKVKRMDSHGSYAITAIEAPIKMPTPEQWLADGVLLNLSEGLLDAARRELGIK